MAKIYKNGNNIRLSTPVPDYASGTLLQNITSVGTAAVTVNINNNGFLVFDFYKGSTWNTGVNFYINGVKVFAAYSSSSAYTAVSSFIPVVAGDVLTVSATATVTFSGSSERGNVNFFPVRLKQMDIG